MSMKIALFTAGFSRYPIERAFEAAARNGYDGIEIGGFRPHAYAPDLAKGGAKKIRQLSADYGLPIVSYAPENTGSPYSLVFDDPAMNAESLEYFKLTLDMAKEIGSEILHACMQSSRLWQKQRRGKKIIYRKYADIIRACGKDRPDDHPGAGHSRMKEPLLRRRTTCAGLLIRSTHRALNACWIWLVPLPAANPSAPTLKKWEPM